MDKSLYKTEVIAINKLNYLHAAYILWFELNPADMFVASALEVLPSS